MVYSQNFSSLIASEISICIAVQFTIVSIIIYH